MYNEYKSSNKRKKIILFLLLVIIIFVMFLTVKDIYLFYKNSIVQIGESSLRYSTSDNSQELSLWDLFYTVIFIIIIYDSTIKNTRMVIDDYGIKIYSLYRKRPNIKIEWENIKCFQIGDVYMGARFTKYGMKIRYLDDDFSSDNKAYVSIRNFENYNQFLEDIEEISIQKNIQLLFMND
ncbi:hypothetical protein [Tepidibacter sp. Z1-5]|uniref:hypothetical protein n=1 Tax=Tepidibacter sp. Z1-5 TaxID=3134138 RepID=UPI0030BA84D4